MSFSTEAREYYLAGQLDAAIAAQRANAGNAFTHFDGSLTLVELLLPAGQFDEAESILLQMQSQAGPQLTEYLQSFLKLIHADRRRQNLLRDEDPAFVIAPTQALLRRFDAVCALREGEIDRAYDLLDECVATAPELTGFVDGRECECVQDGDELFGTVLELLHDGEYLWLPFESLAKMRLQKPESLRDHFYMPALLTLQDGRILDCHLPAIYSNSHAFEDDFRLGRATDWMAPEGGPIRGIGLRLFQMGDEELSLHDFQHLEMRPM